ncbi:GNAT family N-acetyltransferase [Vagococcus entomophilus]|uniref:N-acetyltransferase domain-containing protein n=1 Tax=Vagococcus entomophilus TaxID=1160095 RepID=A0A430AL67_9ENTE|nr:GNAT family N-acetyltransferase [Vagococcus entomophilus]RSU08617.1 hypothetical protein CBF30_05155 [Vagococcus entomophilus]
MTITFEQQGSFTKQEIKELYTSVNWTLYTKDLDQTLFAISHSDYIIARQDTQLIGLIRGVTDQVSILFIQDLLVHPDFQQQQIGSSLIQQLTQRFPKLGQIVLLTDCTDKTKKFYKHNGFLDTSDNHDLLCFYQDLRI